MIKAFLQIGIIGMILLCPAISRAQRESVIHTFQTDAEDATKLQFKDKNKIGVTPLLTYTCSNSATFGTYSVNYTYKICLLLMNTNDFVTTTAVDSLRGVEIGFYPRGETRHNVRLQLSRDSVHWSDSIVSDKMYNTNNGEIRASFVPGRYYVRLTNENGSKEAALWYIRYLFGDCNCVLYIPEE